MRSWFCGLKLAAYGSRAGALPTPVALIRIAWKSFLHYPGQPPWQTGKPAAALWVDPGDRAGQLGFDFTRVPMNERNPKSRLKYFKILPPDFSNPQSSCTLVIFSPGELKILKTPDVSCQASSWSEKSRRDLMKPFKAPHVPEYPAKSKESSSIDLKPVFNVSGSRFRVLHDPSPYPISSGRSLSKFEVPYGLRYNTFTNGTIIQDVITLTRHEVVIQKVFKLTAGGGMLSQLKSKLVPPHPMIQLRTDSEDGTDTP